MVETVGPPGRRLTGPPLGQGWQPGVWGVGQRRWQAGHQEGRENLHTKPWPCTGAQVRRAQAPSRGAGQVPTSIPECTVESWVLPPCPQGSPQRWCAESGHQGWWDGSLGQSVRQWRPLGPLSPPDSSAPQHILQRGWSLCPTTALQPFPRCLVPAHSLPFSSPNTICSSTHPGPSAPHQVTPVPTASAVT